jgi:tRNA modification GTPase
MIVSETIFALASAPGRAGIAIVRVSGVDAYKSMQALTGKGIPPREAALCVLKDPASKSIIDRAVVVFFKGPHSYTGEDTAEYNIHGGKAVLDSLLAVLSKQKNHRMAEPGEFTRRAFENGKLDLTEAEAVADLINAETEAQKIQALSQMEGALSRLYQDWTHRLKTNLAHLEADIEFPDEDLPGGITAEMKTALLPLLSEISNHLSDNRRGERLRDGIQVAVIGAPNAGKSSLVNALAHRDIAIVSDMPGTTRDVIEAHLDVGGYPVILADTAGLRPAQLNATGHDAIESEGMRRAKNRAKEADIKILLFDAGAEADKETLALKDEKSIVVFNKIDTGPSKQEKSALYISAQTGEGLDVLLNEILKLIKAMMGRADVPSLTRARHRKALEEARDSLNRAINAKLPELMAEDMRLSMRAIGRITGKVDVEDLLDVIFRDFCIGK